jgi:uncharacterized membrane protein YsdA (DUF1294 family)/cold shock CspA family protein
MRLKGKIISWNTDKAYGFIKPTNGGKQVFIHINAFHNRNRRPIVNQSVTYSLSIDKQGRRCAKDATIAGDRLQTKNNGVFSLIVALLFIIIVFASVLVTKLSPYILIIYIFVSLLTFIIYALDKYAAKKGTWRTQESTLHLLSLIGGWPGALVAQQSLRHKSKKKEFRSVYWVTVILNCCTLAWLSTENGAEALQSLIVDII